MGKKNMLGCMSDMMSDAMSNIFIVVAFILIVCIAIMCCICGAKAIKMGGDEMCGDDNTYGSMMYGGGMMGGGLYNNVYDDVYSDNVYSDDMYGGNECHVMGGSAKGQLPYLGIREPWFTSMLEGTKTVEGRLKRGAAASLKAGDMITVARSRPKDDKTEHEGARLYETKVVRVTPYKSFAELVEKEKDLFPGKNKKEALAIYRMHSSEADEAEVVSKGSDGHAVVAIEVEKLSKEKQKELKALKAYKKQKESYAW